MSKAVQIQITFKQGVVLEAVLAQWVGNSDPEDAQGRAWVLQMERVRRELLSKLVPPKPASGGCRK